MISKQNLLKEINVLLELKKRITPLLNQHILSAISFSRLRKDEQDMITERFKNMVTEQTKHLALLKEIKNSVAKGSSNAY